MKYWKREYNRINLYMEIYSRDLKKGFLFLKKH